MQWSYDPPYTIHYKGCEFELIAAQLVTIYVLALGDRFALCENLTFPWLCPQYSYNAHDLPHWVDSTHPPLCSYPTPHPPLSLRQKPRVPHWDHSTTWVLQYHHSTTWVLQYHRTTVASFGLRCPMQWFTNPPLLVDHNCGIGTNFYNRGFDDIKYSIPMCPIKNAQTNRF